MSWFSPNCSLNFSLTDGLVSIMAENKEEKIVIPCLHEDYDSMHTPLEDFCDPANCGLTIADIYRYVSEHMIEVDQTGNSESGSATFRIECGPIGCRRQWSSYEDHDYREFEAAMELVARLIGGTPRRCDCAARWCELNKQEV